MDSVVAASIPEVCGRAIESVVKLASHGARHVMLNAIMRDKISSALRSEMVSHRPLLEAGLCFLATHYSKTVELLHAKGNEKDTNRPSEEIVSSLCTLLEGGSLWGLNIGEWEFSPLQIQRIHTAARSHTCRLCFAFMDAVLVGQEAADELRAIIRSRRRNTRFAPWLYGDDPAWNAIIHAECTMWFQPKEVRRNKELEATVPWAAASRQRRRTRSRSQSAPGGWREPKARLCSTDGAGKPARAAAVSLLRGLDRPAAVDLRRMSASDRLRLHALDGERVHPQPGPWTVCILEQDVNRVQLHFSGGWHPTGCGLVTHSATERGQRCVPGNPLQMQAHPSTPNGGERLWVHTDTTLNVLQPYMVPFDDSLAVGAARATLVLRPGSATEGWALIIDLRRNEGADTHPELSRRHDLILHSAPHGGCTLRIAAAHPHILRIVFSNGANLHGSIHSTCEQLREASGNCCLVVPTYQSTFITRTLATRVACLSAEGHASLQASRAPDIEHREALRASISAAASESRARWPSAAMSLGMSAQEALQSRACVYDNATGGMYVPVGEGCLGDSFYLENGEKQKSPRLRAYADTGEVRRLTVGIALLLNDVAHATKAAGMASVIETLRLSDTINRNYVYPPESPHSKSLGQTQYGVRLKGVPADGYAWQLDYAVRSVSALHCDNADEQRNVKLLDKYSLKFTGALVYAGIAGLRQADGIQQRPHKSAYGVCTVRAGRG